MASFIPAFTSLGCPDLTLEQILALAQRHQLTAIELRALGGTLDLPAYLKEAYGTPAKLAAWLAGASVKVVAFDTPLRLIGGTAAEREAFLQFVPWAEALGVKWLRAFDGGRTADAVEILEAAATVNWWRGHRASHRWGCDLMVETHDSLVTTPAIQRFLAAAPDTPLLWDTHHTWKKGGEDPVATWQAIKAQVVHIHVKDSVGVLGAGPAFNYVLPGTGEFPVKPILTVLRAEYSGAVSLEWEKRWHPSLAPLDDALTAARENHWW